LKIVARVILAILLLLLLLAIALSLPAVQTRLGQYAAGKINQEYGTDISIEKLSITALGTVKLKQVMIKDHYKDTLIFAGRVQTNILNFRRLYDGDLFFGDIRASQLYIKVKIYKGEEDSSLDRFIALFDTDQPSEKKFLMEARNIYVSSGRFKMLDENLEQPLNLDLTHLMADIGKFRVLGPDITMNIRDLKFHHQRGIDIKKLKARFTYTKKNILLHQLDLQTNFSQLKGDLSLYYQRSDFQDFNNKVRFDFLVESSELATNDIRYFYDELGPNRVFVFDAHLQGTLNNFMAKNLNLRESGGSVIRGDVRLVNVLGKAGQDFVMDGDYKQLTSNYGSLTTLFPELLGDKLPSVISKLGTFTLRGKSRVSAKDIKADFYMATALGNLQTDLHIWDLANIERAAYKGYVILEKFELGKLSGHKEVGPVTLNLDVAGRGFSAETLNTTVSGDVYRFFYNGYGYTNILVNGNFKKPIFQGILNVNDPNLFMDFDGSVNLEKEDLQLDFHTIIDYADLVKLKLATKDTISVFKGEIKMQVRGTNVDDMHGDVYVTRTSFQNDKDMYLFDDFQITSRFDQDNVRTIAINSPDIMQGSVVGKFSFKNVRKMIENSLGSLYANYSPNKIPPGQFMKFNFSIYNKIVDLFLPGISVGTNTVVSGSINSDNDEFRLNFNAPKIAAYDNTMHRVNLRLDNKNPLYNAFIEMDSINTPYYKISDFNLINITANDTLYVRSEFKGGNKAQDYFNLNLYHTIDQKRNSVVGISKSEIKFKDYLWFLNENDDDKNKVVFDKALTNFEISDVVLSHDDQQVLLKGILEGDHSKDLTLKFDKIDLSRVTPDLEQFSIAGFLDGQVNLRQQKNIYQPTAALVIDNLQVNAVPLGRLDLDVHGDDDFRKFQVKTVLENKDVASFTADGTLEFLQDQTLTDIDLRFDRFNLATLSALGGDIVTDVHGFASGTTRIEGNINNPEVNGRLFLDQTGLKVPYLNVTYELDDRSIVDVTETSFLIRNAVLKDPKYNTQGLISGKVLHNKFADWILDLDISSKRILALDTKDSEDAAYFGTAFIDGRATITGPATGLLIQVEAQSEKGTNIKIPINDADAVASNSFIHFLTSREKYNLGNASGPERNYSGLELKFEFDINENAEIEVILDRSTGHGMRGKGRGALSFQINTLGKFNMWGDFQVYEGIYNFKYGGIIDKRFEVKKFSSIVWEGDPMRAVLNLEAIYRTTANPAILLENPSFNRKIPVEVAIGIRGSLSNPEPDFNINFPTVSSVLKSEIQYKLDDRDTRQTQALYLLSSGGFLSPEGVSQSDLAGNLFERASGMFSDFFQDEEGRVDVGIDYRSPDRRPGIEADGRFGFTISTRVNERITVNGGLGVPVGGINESAIVGNVEIQYRVNETGSLNLKVFNRENDINYIGQGIGYTQGVGMSYEVDFDTFREFANRIFKNIKIDKLSKTRIESDVQDSDFAPDYINWEGRGQTPTPAPRMNEEAVPTED
jgi:hypothetical protein